MKKKKKCAFDELRRGEETRRRRRREGVVRAPAPPYENLVLLRRGHLVGVNLEGGGGGEVLSRTSREKHHVSLAHVLRRSAHICVSFNDTRRDSLLRRTPRSLDAEKTSEGRGEAMGTRSCGGAGFERNLARSRPWRVEHPTCAQSVSQDVFFWERALQYHTRYCTEKNKLSAVMCACVSTFCFFRSYEAPQSTETTVSYDFIVYLRR